MVPVVTLNNLNDVNFINCSPLYPVRQIDNQAGYASCTAIRLLHFWKTNLVWNFTFCHCCVSHQVWLAFPPWLDFTCLAMLSSLVHSVPVLFGFSISLLLCVKCSASPFCVLPLSFWIFDFLDIGLPASAPYKSCALLLNYFLDFCSIWIWAFSLALPCLHKRKTILIVSTLEYWVKKWILYCSIDFLQHLCGLVWRFYFHSDHNWH